MNTITKLVMLVVLSPLIAIPVMAAEGGSPQAQVGTGDPSMKPIPDAPAPTASHQTAAESDKTKRGVWVTQNTPIKKLRVDVHLVRGGVWSVVKMELMPGVPGFISCSGDYIWATAVGGWGKEDAEIRRNFKSKPSEREVYRSEITLVGSKLMEQEQTTK